MRSFFFLLPISLCACVHSHIDNIPCNEISPEICNTIGDRIFTIECSSNAAVLDATDVRKRCLQKIAYYVSNMGFDYFVLPYDKGDSYSSTFSYTTNQPVTTYHNYNANTYSNANIYGTGRLSGYSAYGYGNSNTYLSGSSTSYIPVQNTMTTITKQRSMLFIPIDFEEIDFFKMGYYNVSDYINR